MTEKVTEKEKMLAGKLYDPSDEELSAIRTRAHALSREYNTLDENDPRRREIIRELMPDSDEEIFLTAPVQFDYGKFTTLGAGTYINFNFTCLDCARVTVGKNAFIGPNVSFLTPVHPMRYQERNAFTDTDGVTKVLEYAKPITIGDNCWFGGGVTVTGGVTIGSGCVIGAGSVVTRDIPAGTFAAGVPAKPIRRITEADSMPDFPK